MNTRPVIETSQNHPALTLTFNEDATCFAVGMESGFRVFSTDPCELRASKDFGAGIGQVAMLAQTNYLALLGGGRKPQYPRNKLIIWDDFKNCVVITLAFPTPVLRTLLSKSYIVVALPTAVAIYRFSTTPEKLHEFETGPNGNSGLICLGLGVVAFPGRTAGQVQLVNLVTGTVNIIPAHETQLRAISLSRDGLLLATAGEKGTLIRVYATFNGAKLAEFRRGIDTATIYSIAFNTNNSLLAVTSDKATLHVFDLPTPQNLQLRQALVAAHRQASQPRQPNYSRSSRATLGQLQNHGSSPEHTSSSSLSSSRANVTGTFSHRYTNKWGMLQRVPLLPRFFSDTYSFASAPFDVGDELLPSDGGPSDGTANRQALTTDWLSDRPTRGAIGWVSESELVIASAGVSTKWEKFTIAQDANGCRYCVRTGWTRYLKG